VENHETPLDLEIGPYDYSKVYGKGHTSEVTA
jgi:hypothetical protein